MCFLSFYYFPANYRYAHTAKDSEPKNFVFALLRRAPSPRLFFFQFVLENFPFTFSFFLLRGVLGLRAVLMVAGPYRWRRRYIPGASLMIMAGASRNATVVYFFLALPEQFRKMQWEYAYIVCFAFLDKFISLFAVLDGAFVGCTSVVFPYIGTFERDDLHLSPFFYFFYAS